MKKNNSIHFVGIKGVGMAPLAVIAMEAGFRVSGCDIDQEFITDETLKKSGIAAEKGFSMSHVENSDLVIYSGANGGIDNPEVIRAKDLGKICWSQGQAVGEFMKGEIFNKQSFGISVLGTHGKTTTTAIISVILKANKMDPSFLIGTGNIPYLDSNGHYGNGRYFVAEADEYATEPKYDKTAKFLWQKPKIAVITNIELDHPDLYENEDELKNVFLKFANSLDLDAKIVLCLDDLNNQQIIKSINKDVLTYGFSKNADYSIEKISIQNEKMYFWISANNADLGEFVLNVTGEHNALNALAAIVVGLELGISIPNIKSGLLKFMGTKRRFEFVKTLKSGALLFDDYAHHPTEIKKTLTAFKKTYPNKKILCIFQPHTYSRTKKLFEQFAYSLSIADEIILTDIYASQREEFDPDVNSVKLRDKIATIHSKVAYVSNLTNVIQYVAQKEFDKNWILVTMGAGDIYKIVDNLE